MKEEIVSIGGRQVYFLGVVFLHPDSPLTYSNMMPDVLCEYMVGHVTTRGHFQIQLKNLVRIIYDISMPICGRSHDYTEIIFRLSLKIWSE